MTEEHYSGTIRLAEGTYVGEVADWHIEQDIYIDPDTIPPALNLNEWTHTKTITVHGLELTEYGKYWLDQAIADYRRSLPSYKAHVRAKRRRKIERKQKRAAFRRRKRGLA